MTEDSSTPGVRDPVGVDSTRASISRVYDATLGGKDNYDVDRAVCDSITAVAPRWRNTLIAGRRFQERVLRYLTHAGIDQFLDIGAGLPTHGPGRATHEIVNPRHAARSTADRAPVVYVDNDPLCVAHGMAYWDNEISTYLRGSVLEPFALLDNPQLRARIDLARPVGVLVCGLLHHIDDSLDPAGVMRGLLDLLPGGSYVVITHFWNPCDVGAAEELAVELQRRHVESSLGSGWFRSREEITAMLAGLELLPPGLVEAGKWWPDGPPVCLPSIEQRLLLGALARKPGPTS